MKQSQKSAGYCKKQLLSMLIVAFFCLFLTIGSSGVFAQTNNSRSLILSDSYSEHYLSPYLVQYKDKNSILTAQQIVSGRDLKTVLSSVSGSITSLGISGTPVWFSFDVMNRSRKTAWKIDFGNGFMGRFGLFDNIESYVYDRKNNQLEIVQAEEDGSTTLHLPTNQKSQIILKIKPGNGIPTTVPLRLLQKDKVSSTKQNSTLIISIILLIGMAFFFAAIALMKSNYSYLHFSVYYILLAVLLVLQNSFVIFNLPLIGSSIVPLLFLCIAISGFLMARLFWNMDESSPFANMAFWSLIGLSIACFTGALIFPFESFITSALFYVPSLFIIALIPLISIVQTQQGNNEATPFMFGWFIFLFGISITILSLSGIMQPVSTAINAYWYTLAPQALFFIFALKMKLNSEAADTPLSKTLEITENDSVSRLRQSKENTEQERLLKVIEQERKVLGELRKSEARRTEEMRKAKEEADQANKAKSAFLAVVSHEIRTPMTGIMGMVRLLLDSNLTKEQKEFTQTIQDSSDAMLALLNDILDFEKIEQGKMTFENISFDLQRLVQGVATLMNGHAAQKNIELKLKTGNNLPRYVKGDPTRLRQVLLNLTGNAIKFTDSGQVTITAELIKDKLEEKQYEIYFGVTDSGIGISQEAQKNLFNPFSQADSSISRKFGGTGLGLAISKGLIEGMGSSINISSNQGEGSTFFFTLNMTPGQSGDAAKPKKEIVINNTEKPLHILVVDDNEINQKVIQGFLESSPHKLEMADNVNSALKKAESGNFDLILMDIELPGMRGDEATVKMRQSDNEKLKKLPVIALTGNTQTDDIKRFYDSGMNGFIAKPISPNQLNDVLTKAGNGILENPITPIQPPPLENEKKKTTFTGGAIEVSQKQLNEPEEDSEIKATKKVFKPETLETLKGHLSKDDIQEMLDDVIQKTEEIIDAMSAALEKEDSETLSAKGHELKGMAGNFGLNEISHQAAEIEIKAKNSAAIILTGLVMPLPDMQKRAKEALDHWMNNQ